jgi:hypothetical protein
MVSEPQHPLSTEAAIAFVVLPVLTFGLGFATAMGIEANKELREYRESQTTSDYVPSETEVKQLSRAFTDALNATVEDGAPFEVEVYDRRVAPSSPPAPGGMD